VTGRRVALVSITGDDRTQLAEYLKNAGFDIHECALPVPSSFGALVLLSDETSSDRAVKYVRSWMRQTKTQRVVVVTTKPTALRDLVTAHGARLFVLPAPAFAWELVEALRATPRPTPKPRGA